MSTILVTGATGNVGREVVRALRERDVVARAFVRDPDRARAVLESDVDLAPGDFTDPGSLRQAMRDVDAVFLTSADGPAKVEHECAVIDAAASTWVPRIVKLSSPIVELGSDLGFWDWHARIERHLRGAGVPAVVLRANFLMSNLLAAAETVAATGKLIAPAGSARIAMVDPVDVGAAAAATLTGTGVDGDVYRITGAAAITYDEVAAALATAIGSPVSYVDVPDEAARGALLASGAPDWLADNLVRLFGKLRAGACEEISPDTRELTGRPQRTIASWARDNAAAFTRSATPA